MIAGRYEVTAAIGRGGMGEVWAAYDTRLDRRVALKLLRPELVPTGTQGRAVVARFKREARLTARLEHPGVPAVFDVGAEDDVLYIAMQLVDGQDLGDVLAGKGALPVGLGGRDRRADRRRARGGPRRLARAPRSQAAERHDRPRRRLVRVLDFGVAALLDPEITRVTTAG